MKRFLAGGLRARLLLLVLVAILPSLVLILVTGREARRMSAENTKQDAMQLAVVASGNQDLLIESTRQLLAGLARLPEVRGRDARTCSAVLASLLKQHRRYNNIIVVRPNGDLWCSGVPATGSPNYADRAWFPEVMRTRSFVIGEYVVGRVTKKPQSSIAYPVVDAAGRVDKIIVTGFGLEWLNEFVTRSKLPAGSVLTVIDRNGTVLARTPEPEKWVGQTVKQAAIVDAILTRRERGALETTGIDGIKRLYAFVPLGTQAEGGLYVFIGIPTSIAYAQADWILMRNLAALGLAAILALIIAWTGGNLIFLRRINALLSTAKRLEDGELSARTGITPGVGELSKLARAFDRMAESLEQRIAERRRAEDEERKNRETAERLAGDMAIMAEIGRLISSTPDIDAVYERFAIEARKLIPFDRLVVNLHSQGGEMVTVAYTFGDHIPGRSKGSSFPLKGSVSEALTRTRAGLYSHPRNVEEMNRLFPKHVASVEAGMRSVMGVPLIYRDEVIGSLHFRSKTASAYNEQSLRRAERIGAQIAGAIGTAQLFSDLKNTENSLRESEGRFRGLVEHAAVGVAEVDIITGRFLTVNRRLCEMVGRTEGELLDTSFPAITHPDDRHLHEAKTQKMLAGKIGDYSLEKRYLRKDGENVWVNITVSPLWKPGETPGRNIVVIEDITNRKRMEEERQTLVERLQRAEKMEALGQLAGGVAHDLNNVLGILSGYSELLLEEIPAGHRSRRHAERILQSTEKGAAIIEDLLTLARRGVAASEVIDLNGVVAGFLKSPVFEKIKGYHPRVAFATECDPNLLKIKGSPVHLEKTLMNLVSNAAESISGTGAVTIRTEGRYLDRAVRGYDEVREGEYAVLTVSDTGTGIPAENREKIFEPFYTKKAMGRSGTGLGLAIVWGTVKDHNGYIDLQTEVGTGSTFTLYFPVSREEMGAQEQKRPVEGYLGAGESVLVVDDIAEQRDVAAGLLRKLGYKVHTAASGEETVEYLRSHTADILILDMIMAPGIDGLETYRRVQAINPGQKAILVSGFSETDRVREAQRLGAGAYVKKPYLMEKIGLAIREELDKERSYSGRP